MSESPPAAEPAPAGPDALAGPGTHPELAAALRSRVGRVIESWAGRIRRDIPAQRGRSADEAVDHLGVILPQIAASLEAGAGETRRLMDYSPAQGMSRFHQDYDLHELFAEDRLLRRITIEQTAEALGRPMDVGEQAALNAAIDLMLQQSVVAFVAEQQGRLREATDALRASAEAELKHLSFLSHDLRNNLNAVTVSLHLLRDELSAVPEFAEEVGVLDGAQRAIRDTVDGMGRLLESERARRGPGDGAALVGAAGPAARRGPVDVAAVASRVASRFAGAAAAKGLRVEVDAPAELVAEGDDGLLTVVLQNLIGNAVKFAGRGVVRVRAARAKEGGVEVSVSDEGPGIAPEHVGRIFDLFERGETHEQDGVGLGLSIAARSAGLLGGELTVASTPGVGSTFTLRLPPGGA